MPLAPAMSTKANTLTGQSHLKKYSESAIEQILNFFKQAQYIWWTDNLRKNVD